MVTSIGDFLQKAEEYQKKYRNMKEHKSVACVVNADLVSLESKVKLGEDYNSLKEKMYNDAKKGCDFYFLTLEKLSQYEEGLGEEEREFVAYAGKNLSLDDISYFVLQADIGKKIEITKENIETLVKDIGDLGYQSFRYHEAVNFVGTKESFEMMFSSFYEEFKVKDEGANTNGEKANGEK